MSKRNCETCEYGNLSFVVEPCISCKLESNWKPKKCRWAENNYDGTWETGCGEKHVFIAEGPKENNHKYCPYCGGELIEIFRKLSIT
jgi:hypothetical protein